jgi:hypothetical protein
MIQMIYLLMNNSVKIITKDHSIFFIKKIIVKFFIKMIKNFKDFIFPNKWVRLFYKNLILNFSNKLLLTQYRIKLVMLLRN